jgi:TRAP-type C4-dicarboxylate transport system permease small subunit
MSIVTLSDRIAKALMLMAAFWAFVLCFIILTDIIGRGVFNAPLHGTKEIVANSIVMIVFLQAGYAIRSRSMLRADFLVNLLPAGAQKAILLLGYLLGAAFFVLMITGGWELAVRSFVNGEFEGEGALRVPVWPTRWMILIGGALAILNYLVLIYLDVFAHEDVRLEDEAR